MNEDIFESRKKDHIQCSLKVESQSFATSDWEKIRLTPEALPEINFNEINLTTASLNSEWNSPFFVSSMTAGHSDSLSINSILAEACERKGWLLGVGSQRRELEDSKAHIEWQQIRKKCPQVLLASNIGISQLVSSPLDQIQKIVENTQAKALFIHVNPLQECLQIEGTPFFRGGYNSIEKLVKILPIPIVIKEVGSGISINTIHRLANIGVSAVDIGGRGGTHWGRVEGLRSPEKSMQNQAAQIFKDWGLSTPRILKSLAESPNSNIEIWASGGIRNGLQAAKCLAMGATRVGLARPFLEAALINSKAVIDLMEQLEYELKISLFCLGFENINQMKQRKVWQWETE